MILNYLSEICDDMALKWPDNKTIHIVCHGHSVPAGFFATPYVDHFNAYPHLLHRLLKERFPHAVINVIVTGSRIGQLPTRNPRRPGRAQCSPSVIGTVDSNNCTYSQSAV